MKACSWERLTDGHYWMYNDATDSDPVMVEIIGTSLLFTGNSNDQLAREYPTSIFLRVDAPKLNREMLDSIQSDAFQRFHELNAESKFPTRVEGYWRRHAVIPPKDNFPGANMRHYVNTMGAEFPWPVPMEIEGFDVQDFINKLVDIEEREGGAEKVLYRGFSICRLTGENLGNAEFEFRGWKWPDGLVHYIRMGVPPSAAFYHFITGMELNTLPNYNRALDE